MNISGSKLIRAPRERVWCLLLDPQSLGQCLPGCRRFEAIGLDSYEATLTMGVAAVKGTYEGHVQITDKDKPSRYGLALEASGSSGTVRGTGSVELDETQDGTSIRWTADAQVSGAIASVGQRLIGGVARMVADEFFKCIERQIGETSATEGVPAQRP